MINRLELGTAPLASRLRVIRQAAEAGYPLHLSFAPVFPTGNYQHEYEKLLTRVRETLLQAAPLEMLDLSYEVLIHYLRPDSESVITHIAPEITKGMVTRVINNRSRLTYPDKVYNEALLFFQRLLNDFLPTAELVFIA